MFRRKLCLPAQGSQGSWVTGKKGGRAEGKPGKRQVRGTRIGEMERRIRDHQKGEMAKR